MRFLSGNELNKSHGLGSELRHTTIMVNSEDRNFLNHVTYNGFTYVIHLVRARCQRPGQHQLETGQQHVPVL